MERSRKGTKLNDAQYFRQPLPHMRKKMTKLRIIPTMTTKISTDSVIKSPIWMKYRSNSLSHDQPSKEVTMISYKDQHRNNHLNQNLYEDRREIAVETSPQMKALIKTPSITGIISEFDVIKSPKTEAITTAQLEKKLFHVHEKIHSVKKERNIRSHIEAYSCESHRDNIKQEKTISWWKIIVNFFGTFLSKRESDHEKQSKKEKIIRIDPRMQVTMILENPNNHQYYTSSIDRKNQSQFYKSRDLNRKFREHRCEDHRHWRDENVGTRLISSPSH